MVKGLECQYPSGVAKFHFALVSSIGGIAGAIPSYACQEGLHRCIGVDEVRFQEGPLLILNKWEVKGPYINV